MGTLSSLAQGHEGTSLATALRGCVGGAVVFVDSAGQLITATAEASRLLGLQPQLPAETQPLPAALRQLAAEALTSGKPLSGRQIELTSFNPGARALEVSALPVRANGKASGVLLLLADLDSLRECEERLLRLDRLANLGTLAATMAHEIKNALVAGRTFMDLLLEKNPEAELTDVVRREMNRVDAIVGRLLKFAGPARDRFADLRVHEVLEHVLRLVQPQLENREITLERRLEAGSDGMNGDEGELVQAFMNLVLNAIEAMGIGGKLTVTTTNAAAPGGAISAAGIWITIADTGVGIPPENLERLFAPFFTTKPSGTGLGLAVTKRIIQEHRGELTVESEPGKGTTFSIFLPGHR